MTQEHSPKEEWENWIGKESEVVYGPYEAGKGTIGYFCEIAQDANPLYHDEEYAKKSRYGSIICPPSMMFTLGFAPTWTPTGAKPPTILFASEVPLDADLGINSAVEQEFYLPVRPGDRVHWSSKIIQITPRQTRLGSGYFLTEEVTYWNQKGEKVAVSRNILYRYRKSG